MNFTIRYLNYEGDVKRLFIEDVENEEDAISKAFEEDIGYGDGIFKIIDVD